MKRFLLIFTACITLVTTWVSPVLAVRPEPFTVSGGAYAAVWRAEAGPSANWTTYIAVWPTTSSNITRTGNLLHTTVSVWAPDAHGTSTQYVYEKKSGLWIQRREMVAYTMPEGLYGLEFPARNYYCGYLAFSGAPSDEHFLHGVTYEWIYVDEPSGFPIYDYFPYSVWNNGAWLVGFNVHVYDKDHAGGYNIPFPDPFIEPVPPGDYNPLGL